MSVTRNQLGGTLCPCVKVPYPADGLHNEEGATALANTAFRAGDTVLGFSLGSQVISLYLAQHTPPPGVRFVASVKWVKVSPPLARKSLIVTR